jgi:hypothetical protein
MAWTLSRYHPRLPTQLARKGRNLRCGRFVLLQHRSPLITRPQPSMAKSPLRLRSMEDEKEHHHGKAAKRIDE